ncbi:MAG TPA: hypothetical protein VIE46_12210 [Gemmatimonadales bacterium]
MGIAALVALLACGRAEPQAGARRPLVLHTTRAGDSLRLELMAATGWKINARLKPVLESSDGGLVRFDSPLLTPDSAYFTAPPVAVVAASGSPVRGTVRASVCAAGESVCRVVALEVRGER